MGNSSTYLEEVLTVKTKTEYPKSYYGYHYYVEFSPLHEYMTNNKNLFNDLIEGHKYLIKYLCTNRLIAPNTSSIQIDMKHVKIIKEIFK